VPPLSDGPDGWVTLALPGWVRVVDGRLQVQSLMFPDSYLVFDQIHPWVSPLYEVHDTWSNQSQKYQVPYADNQLLAKYQI
jgi:hypothetical protein